MHSDVPNPSELCWDFNRPASSEWNQIVISLLMRKLAEMRESEQWTTAPRSIAYWEDAITQKFNRIRAVMSKAKPILLENCTVETGHQVADRLVKAKEESLQKARRDSRRMAVFKIDFHSLHLC